jgi:adenylate cyclase
MLASVKLDGMATEIERKFLVVKNDWKKQIERSVEYRQGYIASDANRSVRVRIGGGKAWLTVKGSTRGISRLEFEYAIPLSDAREMLRALCAGPLIEKTRHIVPYAGQRWEIDVFEGDNAGLIVAEVELDDENERVQLPAWVGAEVSTDARFYNSCLAERPFSQWRESERQAVLP